MHPVTFYGFATGIFFCCFGGFVWIIFLTIYRFDHAGSVVSGDFCSEDLPCQDDEGYMTSSGNFFKVWLIIVYCFYGIGCIQGCFSDLYNKGKLNCGRPAEYFEKYERVSLLGVGAVGTV
jgi:hypothetical protein